MTQAHIDANQDRSRQDRTAQPLSNPQWVAST